MSQSSKAVLFPPKTIGIDLGDRVSIYTERDGAGEVVRRGKLKTTREGLASFFAEERGTRVVYEASTHSPWVTWLLDDLGCETVVANPWRVKLIAASNSKCDRKDADLLSELGHLKPSLLSPIQHRGPKNAEARSALTARKALVETRTRLINCSRGIAKSLGHRLASCSASAFHRRVELAPELRLALEPLRKQIGELTKEIDQFDRYIAQINKSVHPETELLQQVRGVGPVTALTFVLAIDDPARFSRSRDVGSYFGLVPRVSQSGDANPELSITKAGDRTVRTLLVQCAHYILGHFGEDSDLRRHGERIAGQGSKSAKKRAAVAVARKLAVLLHRLWVSGEPYEPLRNSAPVRIAG